MFNLQAGRWVRNEAHLFLGGNLLAAALMAGVCVWLLQTGRPAEEIVQRFGRAGPMGLVLVSGSVLLAWFELLILPLWEVVRRGAEGARGISSTRPGP